MASLPETSEKAEAVDLPRGIGAWCRDFRLAISFLSILPIEPKRGPLSGYGRPGALSRAAAAFPLIGGVLGLIAGVVLVVAFEFGLHPIACALIAVGTLVALTGGLHEDGLADFADGLGGHTPEQRLAIMRDGRIGAFGALSLVFAVGLRASLLAGLESSESAAAALVATAALSRAMLPAIMYFQRPARSDGLAAFAGRPNLASLILAVGSALFIAWLSLGLLVGGVAATVTVIAAAGIAAFAQRRLRGFTGDVLGTAQVVCEIAALFAIAAVE